MAQPANARATTVAARRWFACNGVAQADQKNRWLPWRQKESLQFPSQANVASSLALNGPERTAKSRFFPQDRQQSRCTLRI
jgi:hypothetical protein